MGKSYQTTISNPVKFEGIGLHSGEKCSLKILPAEVNHGVVFKRTDLKVNNLIKACYLNVTSTKLCTTLENSNGAKVSTVEHLLAALYIAEIDNVMIEITSEEVPIMDGSAKNFLEGIKKSKKIEQSEKRKFLKIISKVELIDGERKISIEPGDNTLEVEFRLNYKNSVIGSQKNIINFQKDNIEDVSKSRTFCLFEDIKKIKKAGLAKGGSLENAVVVNDNEVMNIGGLRNEKEFVNHKILDLAGDFLLSGYRILGKVSCLQGGHELSNLFLRKVLNSKTAYKVMVEKKYDINKNFSSKKLEKLAVNA